MNSQTSRRVYYYMNGDFVNHTLLYWVLGQTFIQFIKEPLSLFSDFCSMIKKLICKLRIIFIPHCPLNSVETFWLIQIVSLLYTVTKQCWVFLTRLNGLFIAHCPWNSVRAFWLEQIVSFIAHCLLNGDKPWLQCTLL